MAESLTGGLLAATIVDVPGASKVFRGGLVVYATDLKHKLAGVDADLLASLGPVDGAVAPRSSQTAPGRAARPPGAWPPPGSPGPTRRTANRSARFSWRCRGRPRWLSNSASRVTDRPSAAAPSRPPSPCSPATSLALTIARPRPRLRRRAAPRITRPPRWAVAPRAAAHRQGRERATERARARRRSRDFPENATITMAGAESGENGHPRPTLRTL